MHQWLSKHVYDKVNLNSSCLYHPQYSTVPSPVSTKAAGESPYWGTMGQESLSLHNPGKLETQQRIDQNSSPSVVIKGKQMFMKKFFKHLTKDDADNRLMTLSWLWVISSHLFFFSSNDPVKLIFTFINSFLLLLSFCLCVWHSLQLNSVFFSTWMKNGALLAYLIRFHGLCQPLTLTVKFRGFPFSTNTSCFIPFSDMVIKEHESLRDPGNMNYLNRMHLVLLWVVRIFSQSLRILFVKLSMKSEFLN